MMRQFVGMIIVIAGDEFVAVGFDIGSVIGVENVDFVTSYVESSDGSFVSFDDEVVVVDDGDDDFDDGLTLIAVADVASFDVPYN